MDALFDTVTVERACTIDEIEAAEADLGLAFPRSYRRFCLTYGSGLIGGLLAIATPRPDPADPVAITIINPRLDERLQADLAWCKDEGMEIGVDRYEGVDPPLLGRARFFAQSYDGHELLWDVRHGAEEYDIYVSAGGSTVRFGGKTLDDLIRGCQTDRVKTILGPGYEPLPRTFMTFTPTLH